MIQFFTPAERSLVYIYIRKSSKFLLVGLFCLLLIHYAFNVGFYVEGTEQETLVDPDTDVSPVVEEEPETEESTPVTSSGKPPKGYEKAPAVPPYYPQPQPDTPQPPVGEYPETISHEEPVIEEVRQTTIDPIPVSILIAGVLGLFLSFLLLILLWVRTPKEVRILVEKGAYAPVKHRWRTSTINEEEDIKIKIKYRLRDRGRWGVFQLGCRIPPLLDIEKAKMICENLGLRFDHRKITIEATLEEFMLRYQLFRIGIFRILELEHCRLFKGYI